MPGCAVCYHTEGCCLPKLSFQELQANKMQCSYSLLVGSALVTCTLSFDVPPRAQRCSQMLLLIYDSGTETPLPQTSCIFALLYHGNMMLQGLVSLAGVQTLLWIFLGVTEAQKAQCESSHFSSGKLQFKKQLLPIKSDWVVCQWGDFSIFIPCHLLDGSNKKY